MFRLTLDTLCFDATTLIVLDSGYPIKKECTKRLIEVIT